MVGTHGLHVQEHVILEAELVLAIVTILFLEMEAVVAQAVHHSVSRATGSLA